MSGYMREIKGVFEPMQPNRHFEDPSSSIKEVDKIGLAGLTGTQNISDYVKDDDRPNVCFD
ncbi:unnamed protein product [Dovyalis caffra]|uniref:Uncharacterized protein n=1 Tax=Dovyalis caffra TaxID=77055 RepID=A0AAV1SKC1_9ROSI|nr:unnamed protein product [Dovyalis caffra]